MVVPTRALTTTGWLLAVLAIGLRPAYGQAASAATPQGTSTTFGVVNTERTHNLLAQIAESDSRTDDYYFMLVGDIQNNVRSLRHDVFESIARDVQGVTDAKTGAPIYDRIRFLILLGDLVYEGPSARQWANLESNFAGTGPDHVSYPNIAKLLSDKPVFPAIGNHELLKFRVKTQTRYKDLFDSPTGVANFKQFFWWDHFIANPRVLYPVPSDLSGDMFRFVLSKTTDELARQILTSSYTAGADGRYALKFLSAPPIVADRFAAEKERLAAQLAPIFHNAGYGTLPVISSDNMIAYGVDTGGTIFLLLDSMARGWHYPNFAGLKRALYPDKNDQHRLNLFSESPFNGQTSFYKAAAAYARANGKTIVPMMHHSILNGAKSIHATGLGYNHYLALGLPQGPSEQGDPSLFDEIFFSDVPYFFSACIHGYESFSIISKRPGQPDHELRWTISGGGGGPLRKSFTAERLLEETGLYNQKLSHESDSESVRSIEVADNQSKVGHHYLIVHVRHGQIVDVTPHFLEKSDLPRTTGRPQISVTSSAFSAPSSLGGGVEFSPGTWGMERVKGFLAFVNWRPTVGASLINTAQRTPGSGSQFGAVALQVSPLNLDVYIPGPNIVTLRFPGIESWIGSGGRHRTFMTMGVEMPLLWNLFGRLSDVTVGIKAYVPIGSGPKVDPEFGSRSKLSLTLGYRFKH